MDRFAQHVLAPLVLRLGLAVVFVYHGMSKLGPESRWGTAWDAELPPAVQASVAWGEFLGGVALAIGFLVRLAGLGLVVIMAGAVALVHGKNGFALASPDVPATPAEMGYEYNFVLIVLCLGVVLLGSGPLGLDYWLRPGGRRSGG
jgi:putative oxidoreductase